MAKACRMFDAPCKRQSAAGNPTHKNGNKLKGGIASAIEAPNIKANPSRRQPRAARK